MIGLVRPRVGGEGHPGAAREVEPGLLHIGAHPDRRGRSERLNGGRSLHHAAVLDGAADDDAVAGGGQAGIRQRQFGTGERRFGPFQLGIGLGNLFRAVAGFELGELFAAERTCAWSLIPLGAGGIELTAEMAPVAANALAAPLLVGLQRSGVCGGQCGPGRSVSSLR